MSVYMNENGIHLYIESYQWMRDLGSWSLIQDTDTIVSYDDNMNCLHKLSYMIRRYIHCEGKSSP